MTHTYAILHVSAATYQEIHALLRAAEYHHVFHENKEGEVIDMHGIALQQRLPSREELREIVRKAVTIVASQEGEPA